MRDVFKIVPLSPEKLGSKDEHNDHSDDKLNRKNLSSDYVDLSGKWKIKFIIYHNPTLI